MDPLLALTIFLGAYAGFVHCSPIANPQSASVEQLEPTMTDNRNSTIQLVKEMNALLDALAIDGQSGRQRRALGSCSSQGSQGCCCNCTFTCPGANGGGNNNESILGLLINFIIALLKIILGSSGNANDPNNSSIVGIIVELLDSLLNLVGGSGQYGSQGSYSNYSCTCPGANGGGNNNESILQLLINFIIALLNIILGSSGSSLVGTL